MKAFLINGSPRKKNWNTIALLEETAKGLEEKGFETEIVNLYDYNFKGCISCFLCKRPKDIRKHVCEFKDPITPVLEKCINEGDVIVFGSPVYFSYPTGEIRSFMERLLFPITSYMVNEHKERIKLFNKLIPTAFIFTMNASKEYLENSSYATILGENVNTLNYLLGYSEGLYACNTYQFRDYSKYEANMFDAAKKAESREKQFPKDLKKAHELGKRLADIAIAHQNS